MDNNDNKKKVMKYNILGAIIIAVAVIIIAISGSYAFFVNKIEVLNPENKGVVIQSGSLKMSFADSNVFSSLKAGLIDAEKSDGTIDYAVLQKDAADNKTAFTVQIDAESTIKDANFELYMTDITVSSKLKNKYLKYALYQNGVQKKVGDFSTYDDSGKISLISVESITSDSPLSYELYVWLENDDKVNQADPNGIDLREGTLSFKVGFTGVTKSEA